MSEETLHFVVPGPLEQRTGGYIYDARMVLGLREAGWTVPVHNLDGRFPHADDEAHGAMEDALASLDDGAAVIIDGLAMGGLPEPLARHAERLRVLSLVHHPLADETGLPEDERVRFVARERDALAACRGVVVTSRYTAHRLADYGVPGDRVRAVLPGTEPAPPARGPEPGEAPRLLCVATVTPRKGHDVLVTALTRVRDLPWTCVCAGSLDRDTEYADSVLEQVERAGLAERVTFAGEHLETSLEDLYDRSSAFVLASHYEGYGMALAEALARGLPVVSTTGGAIPHTVPEDAGVLVEPGDAEALAGALRSILPGDTADTDAALRQRLTAGALRHAATLPTWDDSAHAFGEAVRSLLSGSDLPRSDDG